jgi:hypothetical protein
VLWIVILESAKDRVIEVDTTGQKVLPHASYGMTCLLIRHAVGSVPCLVDWKIGVVTRDEDITPMDTNNTPQVDIQGPITRACARQMNLQVISFLRNYSCAFQSSILPNDLIILRNEGEDQQGRGEDLGGVEDQRGRPDQDGSPNRFDFVSVSDSRNSLY